VPGSGLYKCNFRSFHFELYVRYCEPVGDNRWVFYIDHERNLSRRFTISLDNLLQTQESRVL